jgi:hypothetical protein
MAQMSPPIFDPGPKLKGEKRVFQKLRQTSDQFRVLHSLNIAKHKNQIEGEADFVVLAPTYGIFIIEVKGGRLKFQNGQWISMKGTDKIVYPKSPHDQAKGNMYSIQESIHKKFPEMKDVLMAWGVVFPSIDYKSIGYEYEEEKWRIWDANSINDSIEDFIKLLSLKESQRKSKNNRLPSIEEVEKIAKYLRPDFECPRLIKADADYVNEKIERYTKDQFMTLDSISDNKRVVIKGGAGTGKSLIATEAIRREVQAFKKPLFICSNKEITSQIQENLGKEGYFTAYGNYPTVSTWARFLEQETLYVEGHLKKLRQPKDNQKWNSYWTEDLPTIFSERYDFFKTNYLSKPIDEKAFLFYNIKPKSSSGRTFGITGYEHINRSKLSDYQKSEIDYEDDHKEQSMIRTIMFDFLHRGTFNLELKNAIKKLINIDDSEWDDWMTIDGFFEIVKYLVENPESRIKRSSIEERTTTKSVNGEDIQVVEGLSIDVRKNCGKWLPDTKIEVTENSITMVGCSGYSFQLQKVENLRDIHQQHIKLLKKIKDNTFFETSSINPSINGINDDFSLMGDIYFFSDGQRKEWMYTNRGVDQGGYDIPNTEDSRGNYIYKPEIINQDFELFRYFKNILSINHDYEHGLHKKRNPYTLNFSNDDFLERIDNEISLFESEHVKDFYYKDKMQSLYLSTAPKYQYDVIIIDESQDIVKNDVNLHALHRMVKNGLKYGRWMFFLDPMQYSSYGTGIPGGIASYKRIKNRLDLWNPSYATLISNCRNTKEISKAMFKLCQVDKSAVELELSYKVNERVESGIPPIFHYYNDVQDIPKLLNSITKPLNRENVKGKDIQILSLDYNLTKYVEQATKYFNIYTSNNYGQYINPFNQNFENKDPQHSANKVTVNLLEYFNFSNLKDTKNPHSSKYGFNDSDLEEKNLFTTMQEYTPNFYKKRGEVHNGVCLIDYPFGMSIKKGSYNTPDVYDKLEDFLFQRYLGKKETAMIVKKMENLNTKSQLFPQGLKDHDLLLNSTIIQDFTIENPKIISFHDKFYTTTKGGNRIVDTDEIRLMLNLNSWFKDCSTATNPFNRILLNNNTKITDNKICVFGINTDKRSLRIYSGAKPKLGEIKKHSNMESPGSIRLHSDQSLEKAVELFSNFCENHKEFESRSAKHTTVMKFRGMDQKYIVLVGLREINVKTLQSLYIGMSRAKVKLDILASKSLENTINMKLYESKK